MKWKDLRMLSAALGLFIFAICLILFPKDVLEASKSGLTMWSDSVFPSLLPFFITAELLIAFGVVSFLGVLLEPLMRPLFNIPGSGGFVWAMGLSAGFPSGAKFTVKLRKQNKLTREEAERLVSFTNSSSPLFICGAVAVGFFQDAALGILLAICHYGANTLVGIFMRFYKRNSPPSSPAASSASLKTAFQALKKDQEQDERPLGKKLGDAVTTSIHTLFMIGGFIILFSVLYRILKVTGTIHYIALLPGSVLSLLQFSPELAFPWLSGFFEITVGSKLISDLNNTDMLEKAIITAFVLGFSGFSVQAQVASLLAETDIRFGPFFAARWLHGFLAAFLTYLLWEPFYIRQMEQPVYSGEIATSFVVTSWQTIGTWLSVYGGYITIGALFLYLYIIHFRMLHSN
ncbi:sporulation integral membrane protein YlbJ [Alteribacillus sp. JSM 102045]|uniref:sporulation integral membrane protein YlbJ n=1 Tax=Alteribacillus sp. JSM 102045 TaxID=1562101 RepID=UPI0035C0DA60